MMGAKSSGDALGVPGRDERVPVAERLAAVPRLAEAGEHLAEVKRVGEAAVFVDLFLLRGLQGLQRLEDLVELGDLLHQERHNVPGSGDGQVGDIPCVVALGVAQRAEEASEGADRPGPDRRRGRVRPVGLDGQAEEQDQGLGQVRRAVLSRISLRSV